MLVRLPQQLREPLIDAMMLSVVKMLVDALLFDQLEKNMMMR